MALTVADLSDESFFFLMNLSPIVILCPFGNRFLMEAGMTALTTDTGGGPPYGTVPRGLG